MFFALNQEQRELQSSVRDFLAARFPLARVRTGYDDPAGADPAELWSGIAAQGWLAVRVPEACGGLGLGLLEAGLVARCFGAEATPGPYLSTVIGAEAVLLGGSEQQQKQWLTGVADGRTKLAVAFRSVPGAPWDSTGVGLTMSAGRVSGTAVNVEFATAADAFVVGASENGQVAMYLVRADDPGVQVDPVPTLDRTVQLGTVRFDAAEAEAMPASGADVLDHLVDRAASLYAHDLVGLAREALSRTVRYDSERMQYGQAIGSFQAVKHVLADLHLAVTMAEHATLYASYALDREDPATARLAASVAKAKASDVAGAATAAMIQFHGGIGFTWEHETHVLFKRAKREEHAYGGAAWHRERIARLLLETGLAPQRQLSDH
jgi:alkylation response protein AidB-like acyl-CoA dehydrogenase